MNDRLAEIAVRDVLRDNLTDPMLQWGKEDRQWIHNDKPLQAALYPRIQIEKRTDTPIIPISLGFDYWEERILSLDVWFWTKINFKWTLGEENLVNEELVKHYLEQIHQAIKNNAKGARSQYGVYARVLAIGAPELDESGQFYLGRVTMSVQYFEGGCQ